MRPRNVGRLKLPCLGKANEMEEVKIAQQMISERGVSGWSDRIRVIKSFAPFKFSGLFNDRMLHSLLVQNSVS